MADYIEGRRAIIEAFRCNAPISCIYLSDNCKREPIINDILRKAKQRNVEVREVPKSKLDELSSRGSHQGVMARSVPYSYVGVGDIIHASHKYADEHEGRSLIVICDHITDAGNLGAIIRSAESVGASGIIIPNKRSARVDASTYKSSAGAISHIPVAQAANLKNTIERLKKEGFWICSASEHAHDLVWDTNLKGKIALVMGNESLGVSRIVLEASDFYAKVPMMGRIESLNVAQASSIFMYEWLHQNL